MDMNTLPKVLNWDEKGLDLERSGVSSVGRGPRPCEDELTSFSNPILNKMRERERGGGIGGF